MTFNFVGILQVALVSCFSLAAIAAVATGGDAALGKRKVDT
jgi:hypothetical protein